MIIERQQMRKSETFAIVVLGFVLWTASQVRGAAVAAESWPCWRGAKGDGLPLVKDIKKDWSGGLKKVWEVTDLCKGKDSEAWSAPVIDGERLVVTGRDGDKDVVFCLNALKGDKIWTKEYSTGPAPIEYGSGPRATPAISGDFVYTFGAMGQLACWKLADGERVWMQEVDKLGGMRPFWGHSSSPLVWKENVIVQGGGKILVAAFDKNTGKLSWSAETGKAGYAAPVIAIVEKKAQLIVYSAAGLVGLDPDTGKKLWAYAHPTAYDMNCSTPVLVGDDQLLVSSAAMKNMPGGTELLKLTAAGPKRVWKNDALNAENNDPVVVGGAVFAFGGYSMDPGDLQCVDLATGNLKWKTAACGGPGTVVCADGLLVCLGNKGKMMLVKPSAVKFEPVTGFQAITGHPVWTAPVFVGNRMYVRYASQLICYEIK